MRISISKMRLIVLYWMLILMNRTSTKWIEWSPCNDSQLKITLERPVALSGRWMSHRCEIRAGLGIGSSSSSSSVTGSHPQKLLRAYEFGYNTSFLLHQFYYSDECMSPLYAITLTGTLTEMKKSWLLPGAVDVDFVLHKVAVMPYTQQQAEQLQTAVVRVCPLARFSSQPWPVNEYQEVLNFELHSTSTSTMASVDAGVSRIDLEFDCLEGINFTFNELHLIRLQRRQWTTLDGQTAYRRELYMGESPMDSHSSYLNTDGQRPVSYLPDFLIKMEPDNPIKYPVCETIDRTLTATHPPSLADSTNFFSPSPPFLLTDLSGQFVSLQECESRPSGSFIRRIISFFPDSLEWQGEYQHYTEPDCQQRSFTILGSGSFSLQETYPLIDNSQKIDFLVVNATVTAHLQFVLQQLASSSSTSNLSQSQCGIGPWILNVPKDITPTNGCQALGLTIPNADFNILRLEHDVYDSTLLFLGQDYQEPSHWHLPVEISSTRPTSFQPALIQCRPAKLNIIESSTLEMTPNNATHLTTNSNATLLNLSTLYPSLKTITTTSTQSNNLLAIINQPSQSAKTAPFSSVSYVFTILALCICLDAVRIYIIN